LPAQILPVGISSVAVATSLMPFAGVALQTELRKYGDFIASIFLSVASLKQI
jgi:hypothetical protein